MIPIFENRMLAGFRETSMKKFGIKGSSRFGGNTVSY